MTAKIIDGREIANRMREEIKQEVDRLKEKGITPGLAVIIVGDDPASQSYVRAKTKACEKAGIYSIDKKLPADTPQEELISLIKQFNSDPKIHGILVQLPLPDHIDESEILLTIDPEKDVDGFHPVNIGKMVAGQNAPLPCTPHGIIQLLRKTGTQIEGAEVVIVGRSNIVGKPLANMLIQKNETGNATVTVCHTRTKNLAEHTLRADILIAAAGSPNTITADMVKEGATVIDVGVNRLEDSSKKKGYRLVGDVDFENVKEKCSAITPVPGGVGPMTITMLLYNLAQAAAKTSTKT